MCQTPIDLRSTLDSESFRELLQAPLQRYCPLSHHWRGSQVVRSRSAKPLFAGSIPAPAFTTRSDLMDTVAFVSWAGSIDSLSPESSPERASSMSLGPHRLHSRPRHFQLRRAKPDDEGEKSPVTQASACASRLIHALPRRCSRRLFCRMLDRTLSYHDRFSAKRRARFRRKERS